jgi:tubulin---tyrosine ligase
MFLNFLEFCDKNNLNVFNYVPFTAVVKINGMNYKENFKNFSLIFSKMKDLTIQENDNSNSNNLPPTPYFSYQDLFKSDINNYKTGDCQVFFPNTHFTGKNLWIIKPTDLWGGRCIQMSDNILEIERIIKRFYEGMEISAKKEEESMSESCSEDEEGVSKIPEKSDKLEKSEKTKITNRYRASTVLLQKYIESPLLYYGRKFDIRMWALIDCKMDLYLFKEGHLKTTSTEYTTESKDKFVHITNYSLQKHNNNFEKFEVGNEVSFKDFQNCLDTNYKESKINIKNDIIPQMVDIIKLTALSVKDKLNKKDRQFCYLLLGYDFMIDTNFKVWLIEINKNPGLVESSPVINGLVPRLLDDCFRLTIDNVFESKYNHETRYPVEGYSDEENMFEFLLSLK